MGVKLYIEIKKHEAGSELILNALILQIKVLKR